MPKLSRIRVTASMSQHLDNHHQRLPTVLKIDGSDRFETVDPQPLGDGDTTRSYLTTQPHSGSTGVHTREVDTCWVGMLGGHAHDDYISQTTSS